MNVDFFACYFFEIVDFFACFLGKSGTSSCTFWAKVDYFWQKMSKIVDYFGHFGTMGEGMLSHPSHPPWLWAWGEQVMASYCLQKRHLPIVKSTLFPPCVFLWESLTPNRQAGTTVKRMALVINSDIIVVWNYDFTSEINKKHFCNSCHKIQELYNILEKKRYC